MHMGTPPGYASAFPIYGPIPEWFEDSDDWRHWQGVPDEAKAELGEYYRKVAVGEIEDRTAKDDLPCLWWDFGTRKCKYHEHRPSTCREFEVGSEPCIEHRMFRGIR